MEVIWHNFFAGWVPWNADSEVEFRGQDVYKEASSRSTPVEERGPKQEWAEGDMDPEYSPNHSLAEPTRVSGFDLSLDVAPWVGL